MRRNRSGVIESVNVEEESDEEDQEARDQCQTEEARSRQGETEEQTQVKTKLKIELSTISTVMAVKGQEIMNLTVQGGREVPRQDGVNESKIERTPQQYDVNAKVYLHG